MAYTASRAGAFICVWAFAPLAACSGDAEGSCPAEGCVADDAALIQARAHRHTAPQADAADWTMSYAAGEEDFRGGSEILHLATHKGELFAANGYWEDSRNCLYGNPRACWGSRYWAQVLRLDSRGQWQEDLALGSPMLRAEVMESITLTTDCRGDPVEENLLIVGAFDRQGTWLWTRDDHDGTWSRQRVVRGGGSVRAMATYRDAGVDRVFLTSGTRGVFSGCWSSSGLSWGPRPESGTTGFRVRPLGFAVANGELHVSAGSDVFRRSRNGHWDSVFTMHGSTSRDHLDAIGGIRGLTTVPTPEGATESLLFVWCATSDNKGCVQRLDPDGHSGFSVTEEACLGELMEESYGTNVYYTIGAYNRALAVQGEHGHTVHLIGFEARVDCHEVACALHTSAGYGGGFYEGAVYWIRRGPSDYVIKEVGGDDTKALVATRAYAAFHGDIYFGGYDANGVTGTGTAWIARSPASTAVDETPSTRRPSRGGPSPSPPSKGPSPPPPPSGPSPPSKGPSPPPSKR